MDDEVLGVGGTIAKHVNKGDEVRVVIVANRIYNHRLDPELVEKDRVSSYNAQKILGYSKVIFLGLDDERLDNKVQDIIIPLEKEFNQFLPDIVYTNHFGDNNQDHRAVFQAARVVTRQAQKNPPSKVLLYETPSSTEQSPPMISNIFLPSYFVNIDLFLDKKILAMQCYKDEIRDFPHPRSIKGIKTYAKFRGIQSNFHHAEAFMIMRDTWK